MKDLDCLDLGSGNKISNTCQEKALKLHYFFR